MKAAKVNSRIGNGAVINPQTLDLRHAKLRLKTLLVPVDFSKQSEDALNYALAFAKVFRSRITLLHATESLMPQDVPYPFPWLLSPADINAQARRRLREWLHSKNINTAAISRIIVAEGRSFDVITNYARKLKADVIVISTHGYSGFGRLCFGSTSERVVRHAGCPVLVVRHGTAGARKKNIRRSLRRILIPTDFSPFSAKALQYAAAILHRFRAKGTLFNAVCPTFYFTGADDEAVAYAQLLNDVQNTSAQQIAALKNKLKSAGLKVDAYITTGDPREEIIDMAQKLHSDLIVLPTHGRTGLKHVLLGSVAEYIVRRAPTAVLVVR